MRNFDDAWRDLADAIYARTLQDQAEKRLAERARAVVTEFLSPISTGVLGTPPRRVYVPASIVSDPTIDAQETSNDNTDARAVKADPVPDDAQEPRPDRRGGNEGRHGNQ